MIKAAIIDSSAVIRRAVKAGLSAHENIRVEMTAPNYSIACNRLSNQSVDVIVLTLDGTFDPTLAVQTLRKSQPTLQVVLVGASDTKITNRYVAGRTDAPTSSSEQDLQAFVIRLGQEILSVVPGRNGRHTPTQASPNDASRWRGRIDAISLGASTGGPPVIEKILVSATRTTPPIAVCQHIATGIAEVFAKRLDNRCAIDIKIAHDGMTVHPGQAIIAPTGYHLQWDRRGPIVTAKLCDFPPVGGHKPSIDTLFESAARTFGRRQIAVQCTGMRQDGANGLKTIRDAGGLTIVQRPDTCTVPSMPNAAIALQAECLIVSADQLAQTIISIAGGKSTRSTNQEDSYEDARANKDMA